MSTRWSTRQRRSGSVAERVRSRLQPPAEGTTSRRGWVSALSVTCGRVGYLLLEENHHVLWNRWHRWHRPADRRHPAVDGSAVGTGVPATQRRAPCAPGTHRTSCSVPRGRALDLLASKPRGGADHRLEGQHEPIRVHCIGASFASPSIVVAPLLPIPPIVGDVLPTLTLFPAFSLRLLLPATVRAVGTTMPVMAVTGTEHEQGRECQRLHLHLQAGQPKCSA